MVGRGFETFRQGDDLVIYTGLPGRFLNLGEGSIRFSVPDILLYASVKDMVLLQDKADVFPEETRIPVTEVHPVQGDRTAVRLVELVQQVHDGGLARPAQSHEGGDLAAFDLQRNIMKRLGPVRIREVHAFHLEIPMHLFRPVIARRFQLGISIDYVEIPFRIDQGIIQVIEYALERGDRCRHVGEQHDVVHDLTDGHPGIADEDQIRGKDDDQDRSGLAYETFQRVESE